MDGAMMTLRFGGATMLQNAQPAGPGGWLSQDQNHQHERGCQASSFWASNGMIANYKFNTDLSWRSIEHSLLPEG